jgi:hypothetical protein
VNEANKKVLTSLITSIDTFTRGEMDLEDIQARVRSASTLLERDTPDLSDELRQAENDLERNEFLTPLDEQRPAAVLLLNELRSVIADTEPAE